MKTDEDIIKQMVNKIDIKRILRDLAEEIEFRSIFPFITISRCNLPVVKEIKGKT